MLVRQATRDDVASIVALLAADSLGATRQASYSHDADAYLAAFDDIASSPDAELLVGVVDGGVMACAQVNYLRHLTYTGGMRAQIEGIRVDAAHRGRSHGEALVTEAIRRAKARGCHLVQLTTDRRRDDALRFYERLGFVATHHGMKLHL